MYISYLDSPIGLIEVTADNDFILKINLVKKKQENIENILSKRAIKQLKEYFNKQRNIFDLPLKLNGTPFQVNIWTYLLNIPYGTTCSYKDIANKINNPKAIRAVGTAIGKNPFLIIIPCHRVIGSNGSLTGYALGLDIKKYLLESEQ